MGPSCYNVISFHDRAERIVSDLGRQDISQKASALANDIAALARRARAARFETTAYILELAAAELEKEIKNGQAKGAKE